jgi:hypothetical protein
MAMGDVADADALGGLAGGILGLVTSGGNVEAATVSGLAWGGTISSGYIIRQWLNF